MAKSKANRNRIHCGQEAVLFHKRLSNGPGAVGDKTIHDEDVVDTVTNVLEYAASQHMDLGAILRMSRGHVEAEMGARL